MSLLNFLNPAIFFINSINSGEKVSFNLFLQYVPAHFGNDISINIPFKYDNLNIFIKTHRFKSYYLTGTGLDVSALDIKISDNISIDLNSHFWNQPTAFWGSSKVTGGAVDCELKYMLADSFEIYAQLDLKSKGWLLGNPFLTSDKTFVFGVNYYLR